MAMQKIPLEFHDKANKIIEDFNVITFSKNSGLEYYAEIKGDFLYLNRKERQISSPIARLKFTGNFTGWKFAIFKWSSEKYDPHEWMFPGSQYLDGTIEGALKAGHEAYPPAWEPSEPSAIKLFGKLLSRMKFKK